MKTPQQEKTEPKMLSTTEVIKRRKATSERMKKLADEMLDLKADLHYIQSRCRHVDETYTPDPSSSHTCTACGRTRR